MHKFRRTLVARPLEDRLARQIAQRLRRCLVTLRLERKLSRLAVVHRTGINWKRIRALEEGSQVACLDEVVKLARVYGVGNCELITAAVRVGPETLQCVSACTGSRHKSDLPVSRRGSRKRGKRRPPL